VHERTILIAGGDTQAQAILAASVAAAGYAVALANGADAPALVSRTDPDAVLFDVTQLAPEAAVAVVRAMRAVTARPLLVLAAPRDSETGPAALDAGADDFLRPPVAALELQARLKALLRPR
jgi:two-component system, OmpR family, response regulator